LALFPGAAANAESASRIKITDARVNVRFGPGLEQPVLAVASKGEIFDLVQEDAELGYYNIVYMGASAWISAELAEPTTEKPGTGIAVKIRSNSSSFAENIRSAPNSSAKVLGKLKNGQQLPLLDKKTVNNYYKVSFNGQTGYVHTLYADAVGYVYLPEPPVYADYFEWVRVTANTQKVYSSPGGEVMGTALNGDILPVSGPGENGYAEVVWDGSSAYIPQDKVESVYPEPLPRSSASWVAIVKISNQTVSVYRNGELVRFMCCSTGTSSTPTPKGTFTVPYRKNNFLSHSLTCFDAIKIIDGTGIYFHRIPRDADGTYTRFQNALGNNASAGCVRLPELHSRWMYENFPNGATVIVK
jgi:uncharacterized protein YgiM (DUF1202 family)